MADGYMLYVGTHAMEDPTRAALLFAAAKAAAAQKYQAKVALLGDAVLLMHPGIAENTLAGPRGSLYKVIAQAIESGVEVHCWDTCIGARGGVVTDEHLQSWSPNQVKKMNSGDFARLSFEAKNILSL